MKVLIYPAGTEIGLEVFRALKYQKDFQVIGANTEYDHSRFVFDEVHYIPDIYKDRDGAIEELKLIIEAVGIDFVFPTHDQVIYELSKEDIPQVILPDKRTAEICRSKSETYKTFKGIVPVPEVYDEVVEFPIFCKPDKGQGSRGTFIAYSENDLSRRKDELMLEYLPGKEYTIDCFTDWKGELLFCEARERSRINGGISTHSFPVDWRPQLTFMAIEINDLLNFRGQWFFQVKEREDGELVLMEIAARAAGSSCLARGRGVNLPLLTLYDRMGRDVEVMINKKVLVVDRALENKYKFDHDFNDVYIDLDDTLIPVKPELIALLYKFKAQGKFLHIVTRHPGDINTALLHHHICPALFTSITQTEDKSSVINRGIFIHDSHRERKTVSEKGIPVFDVQQAIEVLC